MFCIRTTDGRAFIVNDLYDSWPADVWPLYVAAIEDLRQPELADAA